MMLISIDPGFRNMGVTAFNGLEFVHSRTYDLKVPDSDYSSSTIHPVGCAVAVSQFVDELWNELRVYNMDEVWVVIEHNTSDMRYTTYVPTALSSAFISKSSKCPWLKMKVSIVYPSKVMNWLKKEHGFEFPRKKMKKEKRRAFKKEFYIDLANKIFAARPIDSTPHWTPDEADAAINAYYAFETDLVGIDLKPPPQPQRCPISS